VVLSPEVLQLAVLGSFVKSVEKELEKSKDRIAFLRPASRSSL
jgi:hypothetical protein